MFAQLFAPLFAHRLGARKKPSDRSEGLGREFGRIAGVSSPAHASRPLNGCFAVSLPETTWSADGSFFRARSIDSFVAS